jgi:hypothetical protein
MLIERPRRFVAAHDVTGLLPRDCVGKDSDLIGQFLPAPITVAYVAALVAIDGSGAVPASNTVQTDGVTEVASCA